MKHFRFFLFFTSLTLPFFALAQTATSSNPLQVTCTSAGAAGSVTFVAIASGGVGNYTYNWSANGSVATSTTGTGKSSFTIPINNENTETAQVTVNDGSHTNTTTCPNVIAVIQPIVGSCSVEVLPENRESVGAPGRTIRFKALVGGGTGTYTYNWSGTDGLSGTTQDIAQTYTTTGLKTGSVTITSGDQSATLTCSANITDVSATSNGNPTLGGECSENSQTPSTQQQTIWQATIEGSAATSTVAWSGDATGTSPSSIVQYSTPGLKTANLAITGASGTLNLSCQALISSTTDTITGTSGCFIATAAWGTPDQPEVVALRNFRDDTLLTTRLGTDFVNLYYQTSPPIAGVVRQSSALQMLVRTLLRPIVFIAEKIDQK